jgi:uncharacterized membrane protein
VLWRVEFTIVHPAELEAVQPARVLPSNMETRLASPHGFVAAGAATQVPRNTIGAIKKLKLTILKNQLQFETAFFVGEKLGLTFLIYLPITNLIKHSLSISSVAQLKSASFYLISMNIPSSSNLPNRNCKIRHTSARATPIPLLLQNA